MSDKEQDYHDAVQHVSGDDGAADLFQAAGDVGTPPDKVRAFTAGVLTGRTGPPSARSKTLRNIIIMIIAKSRQHALTPSQFEAQGHETVAHHKQRVQVPGLSDAAILTEEGASLPQDTTAGNVKLQGAH